MLLAIDIGNTNIVLGLLEGEKLLHQWRLATHRQHTSDECAATLRSLFGLASLESDAVRGDVLAWSATGFLP